MHISQIYKGMVSAVCAGEIFLGKDDNIINLAGFCWGPPEPKLRFMFGERKRKKT